MVRQATPRNQAKPPGGEDAGGRPSSAGETALAAVAGPLGAREGRRERAAMLQPEEVEAQGDWAPRLGLEIAQSVMFVPAVLSSLGKFSEPETYFPEILQELREDGADYLAKRDEQRA